MKPQFAIITLTGSFSLIQGAEKGAGYLTEDETLANYHAAKLAASGTRTFVLRTTRLFSPTLPMTDEEEIK